MNGCYIYIQWNYIVPAGFTLWQLRIMHCNNWTWNCSWCSIKLLNWIANWIEYRPAHRAPLTLSRYLYRVIHVYKFDTMQFKATVYLTLPSSCIRERTISTAAGEQLSTKALLRDSYTPTISGEARTCTLLVIYNLTTLTNLLVHICVQCARVCI